MAPLKAIDGHQAGNAFLARQPAFLDQILVHARHTDDVAAVLMSLSNPLQKSLIAHMPALAVHLTPP